MNTPSTHLPSASNRLVVDAEGARDIGPSEAAGLVRECLALTHKRYDAALWRALMELEAPHAGMDLATQRNEDAESPEEKIARVVRRDRSKVGPRFRSEFDRLFQERRDRKPRTRDARGPQEMTLALVGESDHSGQVALKNEVEAMKAAVRESGFAFDLRIRMMMRESAEDGEYPNPWGAVLLCDALGLTCRGLWGAEGVWRPIMEHLVRALTPEIVALHAELDRLLQDRDVLPVLKVRTRKRSQVVEASSEPGDLFSKVAQMYGAAGAAAPLPPAGHLPPAPAPMPPGYAPAAYGPPGHAPQGYAVPAPATGGDPLDFGDAAGWQMPAPYAGGPAHTGFPAPGASPASAMSAWDVLGRALELLESSTGGTPRTGIAPGFDPASLDGGAGNVLPIIDAAVAAGGDAPLPRPIVDVVSMALDEVFENPYLPSEVKIIFGRLQIPLLKAALKDREVLADPRHPARRFFDALAAAAVGVRPDVPSDALFIALADHLASVVRDAGDDAAVFETVRDELEHFLDAERASYNQKLAQALPSLLALDEAAEARAQARTALAVRIGMRALPPEVRDFIDHECLDSLGQAYVNGGPDTPEARQVVEFVDDLLWSIAPDRGPAARKRLLPLVPRIVRTIFETWPPDEKNRVRRKVFLARLYELHMEALKTVGDLPLPVDELEAAPSRMRLPIPDLPPQTERDEALETVEAMLRGDWIALAGDDDGAAQLAKFAWRSPHGSQILFTHRDGSIAVIHSPQSLAAAFRDGKAKVAVEAVPLFERAMEKLLEQRR